MCSLPQMDVRLYEILNVAFAKSFGADALFECLVGVAVRGHSSNPDFPRRVAPPAPLFSSDCPSAIGGGLPVLIVSDSRSNARTQHIHERIRSLGEPLECLLAKL